MAIDRLQIAQERLVAAYNLKRAADVRYAIALGHVYRENLEQLTSIASAVEGGDVAVADAMAAAQKTWDEYASNFVDLVEDGRMKGQLLSDEETALVQGN